MRSVFSRVIVRGFFGDTPPDPGLLKLEAGQLLLLRSLGLLVPGPGRLFGLFGCDGVDLFCPGALTHQDPQMVAGHMGKTLSGSGIAGLSGFGAQTDLLITPDQFETFFLPWIERFSRQAHELGYQSVLHCCGSIYRIIDRLVEAGVDCIHPIQAKAHNMDAEYLATHFKGRLAFMGGIDTQEMLPEGSPEEVAAEVRRVADLLGPRIILGPSHEVLMPNVPYANVKAMSEAVFAWKNKNV